MAATELELTASEDSTELAASEVEVTSAVDVDGASVVGSVVVVASVAEDDGASLVSAVEVGVDEDATELVSSLSSLSSKTIFSLRLPLSEALGLPCLGLCLSGDRSPSSWRSTRASAAAMLVDFGPTTMATCTEESLDAGRESLYARESAREVNVVLRWETRTSKEEKKSSCFFIAFAS